MPPEDLSKTGRDKKKFVPIVHLLPNLLTLAAICAGLTAIRFGYQGDFEQAVRLILLACILDGVDGRLARLLRCQSQVGAELDSLADFVNFGVAPGLIIHAWALQDFSRAGWIAVLCYSICCVLRLARFNVNNRAAADTGSDFFVGVPSPAGAILAMVPMYVAFLFGDATLVPPAVVAGYILLIGLLMISQIPTYSFKNLSIYRENAKFWVLGAIMTVVALFTYLWATLLVATIVYVGGLIWAFWSMRKTTK
ncbi:CDP-diacylglycerol--serine O-phosphatidyltransferase [Phaeobacter sp. J2-8]|uniref:CDP-diacylglycerol--serine O-phosphatidyltransferase n=1 Tax=Phaeobacter sp. J2-8 TaxID=2931394 RepID=UPI001FCF836A|nr:CDP-diacylglycerol--serine O-phosphatidyltransferase [Phaeobacter sp. J2-8]MCJ7871408.1 CDP-diacylglycerol--serine O-phosphatidyltransferase [Phaeobacter sp. J2-8]